MRQALYDTGTVERRCGRGYALTTVGFGARSRCGQEDVTAHYGVRWAVRGVGAPSWTKLPRGNGPERTQAEPRYLLNQAPRAQVCERAICMELRCIVASQAHREARMRSLLRATNVWTLSFGRITSIFVKCSEVSDAQCGWHRALSTSA